MPLPFAPDLPADMPVLIAGPTGQRQVRRWRWPSPSAGRRVVNADAIQVYANWRVLTARPAPEDEARVPHRLYGHVARRALFGRADGCARWRRCWGPERPVIVGGTGLYFSALTEGLADIPPRPARDSRAAPRRGWPMAGMARLLADLDAATLARIDRHNPRRVQRAWEVLRATGHGLAAWQDATPPPLLPPAPAGAGDRRAEGLARPAARDALRRDAARGALDEARDNLPLAPDHPSAKAIGAARADRPSARRDRACRRRAMRP